MKRFNILFITIILIINLWNCNNPNINFQEDLVEEENSNGNTSRTVDDVRQDFQDFDLQPGINDVSLESTTEGLFWNFRVIVPEGTGISNKKPLIFSLHGGAQNINPEAHKSTDCLISPGLNDIIDAYIISPNSNAKLWYDQNNQIQILALLDLASSYLYVNTNKIVITGYSDGGNGSWFYSQYYPNKFSAAIPMATSYNTIKNNGIIDPIEIPLYVIHGANDELFPLETTQSYVNKSIEAGSDIQFVIAKDLDHYQVCDYVPYLRDAAQWLVNTVWD
ncbi:Dienelactone hydrolase family protein [Flaviramulus basaltis]|uniref:Dienelactone hydrolase family protein n=1 Tax=Flaviramulus basaltis TaxID=369401 RepID=A0A1K2IAH6_9FLAO|nr:dienelactone hydrolase family protein [Flaviramulus basaltis]SFZ89274.1 Dienelactone hydrolase family protein [Flaviramulus basaltis]